MPQIRQIAILLASSIALGVMVTVVACATAASPADVRAEDASANVWPYAAEAKLVAGPLPYESEFMRKSVERWERAASGMHKDAWFHQPWTFQSQPPTDAAEWWSTTPGLMTREGGLRVRHRNEGPSQIDRTHLIHIQRDGRNGAKASNRAFLSARWQTPELGCISIQAFVQLDKLDHFSFWYSPSFPAGLRSEAISSTGWDSWYTVRSFSGVEYLLTVDRANGNADQKVVAESVYRTLLRWSSSADLMKKELLAVQDELEDRLQREIASGKVITKASIRTPGELRGNEPPTDQLTPSNRELTEDEKKTVVADAAKQFKTRRALIEDHYKALHIALNKVFPLKEIYPLEEN